VRETRSSEPDHRVAERRTTVMQKATDFLIAVRVQELRNEAARNHYARADRPSPLRKLVDSVIETLRASSDPATPTLNAYPYAR
jgi:hypothetical protein